MARKKFFKIEKQELLNKLKQGTSIREIARSYDCANITIHRLLDEYKIEVRVTTEIIDHNEQNIITPSPNEKKAYDVLTQHNIKSVPTPLETIVDKMGYTIKKQPFGDDFSAMLVKKTIYINSDESPVRNNFSLAHELGHIILHSKEDHTFKPVRFRSDTFSDEERLMEKEANEFAAFILMPSHCLNEDIKHKQELTDSEIKQLADKYHVSNQAMSIRLSNLGFEKLF